MDTLTSSALTPESMLDTGRALQFLGGDTDVLRELLQAFMLEAPAELAGFEAAIAEDGRDAQLRYLHRLVPTLAIFATEALHQEARTLYQAMQDTALPQAAHRPRSQALGRHMHALLGAIRLQLSR